MQPDTSIPRFPCATSQTGPRLHFAEAYPSHRRSFRGPICHPGEALIWDRFPPWRSGRWRPAWAMRGRI